MFLSACASGEKIVTCCSWPLLRSALGVLGRRGCRGRRGCGSGGEVAVAVAVAVAAAAVVVVVAVVIRNRLNFDALCPLQNR